MIIPSADGGSRKRAFGDHEEENFGAHEEENFGAHEEENFGAHEEENFGAHDTPIYEGFTNSGFTASSLVRGENLNNLLKAVLIALILCTMSHQQINESVVNLVKKLLGNSLSDQTVVCVLVFVVGLFGYFIFINE